MKQTNKQKTPQNNKEISFFFDNSPLIKFKSLLKNITTKMLVSVTYQVCFSLILKKKMNKKTQTHIEIDEEEQGGGGAFEVEIDLWLLGKTW